MLIFPNKNAVKDFQTTITVPQTPRDVYDAINNVPGWWGNIEGCSKNVGDEFTYRHGDMHSSKHRITESIPGKKVVWLTVKSELNFVADKGEWNGSTITFEISEQDGQTALTFTQQGLTPELECYNACSGAWTFYVNESLQQLLTTGQGQPDDN